MEETVGFQDDAQRCSKGAEIKEEDLRDSEGWVGRARCLISLPCGEVMAAHRPLPQTATNCQQAFSGRYLGLENYRLTRVQRSDDYGLLRRLLVVGHVVRYLEWKRGLEDSRMRSLLFSLDSGAKVSRWKEISTSQIEPRETESKIKGLLN